jgi:hypothetical protein
MKIYEYKNYNDYVNAQTEANVRKINNIWVNKNTIQKIKLLQPEASVILCHGTRNGAELEMFNELYNADIVGTEISYTASKFQNTIQHDFHEELPSHTGKCDIIYSNSFDHSYDPHKCMKTWVNQLNENGLLFVELIPPNKEKKSDPLRISDNELIDIVERCGAEVTQIHKVAPKQDRNEKHYNMFIIKRIR